jgi:hypothetical protein
MLKKIKGYMTFRYGKPLECSTVSLCKYEVYADKAKTWQDGDKSVPVVITYHCKK